MSAQYTRGPWEVFDDEIMAHNETPIALVQLPPGPNPSDEWQANICLIAAAPELLDALKEAERTLVLEGYESYAALKIVRAAIAKAEGR